jgi:hypothetical protein
MDGDSRNSEMDAVATEAAEATLETAALAIVVMVWEEVAGMSYWRKRWAPAYNEPQINWMICMVVRVRFRATGTRMSSAESVK